MKILKGIGIGLLALIAILGIGGFLIPRPYHVERSRTIAASVPDIQGQIADLRNWQKWNPWAAYDPNMQVVYGPKTVGVGASYSWKSEKVGDGSLTLLHVSPDSIRQSLDFGLGAPPVAAFHFTPQGPAVTQVRWTMDGDLGFNPFPRWYSLMMDHFVGNDYEKGLANLAAAAEKK